MPALAKNLGPLPEITTPVVKMTGLANRSLPTPEITTPVVKMTGLANRNLPVPEITTPTVKMTGLAGRSLPVPDISTSAIKMTGLRGSDVPTVQQSPETVGQGEVVDRSAQVTFEVVVELENMPREAESFEVEVHVASSGQAPGDKKAVKNISGGRFSGVVTVPMTFVPGETMSYRAKLSVCNGSGGCFWPLGSGAPDWAKPEPGSDPHISEEGALGAETEVSIPTFTMTGNKRELRGNAVDSFRQGFDLEIKDRTAERSSEKNSHNGH